MHKHKRIVLLFFLLFTPEGKQKWTILGDKNKELSLATNELGMFYQGNNKLFTVSRPKDSFMEFEEASSDGNILYSTESHNKS